MGHVSAADPRDLTKGIDVKHSSPLRYPGGKTRLTPFITSLLQNAGLTGGTYAEPYAGGAGVALSLLFGEYVDEIFINDLSAPIAAFWRVCLEENAELVRFIETIPLTLDEWQRQRAALMNEPPGSIAQGLAAFYLNRTNRSGIIRTGGVIGGLEQNGKWTISARFPREELVRRVKRVAAFQSRVHLSSLDALEFVGGYASTAGRRSLLYLDPPYYHRAANLYDHSYQHEDHEQVARAVRALSTPWLVTYDDCEEIREIYGRHGAVSFELPYSAARKRRGSELVFACDPLMKHIRRAEVWSVARDQRKSTADATREQARSEVAASA